MRRLLISAMFLVAATASAQRKSPVMGPVKLPEVKELPPGLVAGLPQAERYMLGELAPSERALLAAKGRVPHIGVHRPIGSEALSGGQWETLPNGAAIWRFAIHSPSAAGMRVQFRAFSAGSGKVWVYGADGQSQGPYTDKGIFGNGDFWSGTVWGDTATIEYQPVDDSRSLPFEIQSISHRVASHARSSLLKVTAPAIDPAGACNLDVICYPEWSDAVKMVAETIFETEDNGQQVEAACTPRSSRGCCLHRRRRPSRSAVWTMQAIGTGIRL